MLECIENARFLYTKFLSFVGENQRKFTWFLIPKNLFSKNKLKKEKKKKPKVQWKLLEAFLLRKFEKMWFKRNREKFILRISSDFIRT